MASKRTPKYATPQDKSRWVTVAVERDEYTRLRAVAQSEDRSISKQLARVIREWLAANVDEGAQ